MPRRRARTALPLLLTGILATGCGAAPPPVDNSLDGHGPITYAIRKDTDGTFRKIVDNWNSTHPERPVRIVELPEDTNLQRQQLIQNAQMRSDAFDVLSLDVVWTAEFAAHRWILELPRHEFPMDEFLPTTVETGEYRDRLYSVPAESDGALLYYRTDLLGKVGERAPRTWADMTRACAKILRLPEARGMSCYAGQHEKYEGGAVNFAEAVNSAGGVTTDENGRPNVDTPEARRGLDFLVEGYRSGMIPNEALTFKEEESRRAFQSGKLVFHRQWPSPWSVVAKKDGSSAVAGKFAVAPIPGLHGPGVSSLGGHNVAISSFAKNRATAMEFMKFYASEQQQRVRLTEGAIGPTLSSLYNDPALRKQYPYLSVLKQSLSRAVPRPRVVPYGKVTAAIQECVYSAMRGDKSSRQALSDLQARLEELTR